MLKPAITLSLLMLPASVLAAPVFNPANGHSYEFVAAPLSFADALAAASGRSFAGRSGHLATITSDAERDFVFANVTQSSHWLAGGDGAVEGTWRWLAGAETGQIFWQDGVTITYASWGSTPGFPAEPNNVGDEDGLIGSFNGNRIYWNDGGVSQAYGYLIEYGAPLSGAVPEPATWAMLIAGFGAVGATVRRRPVRVLA